MFNNFKFAFRDLRRNKLLAAINVLGLSMGISGCLIIYLIASYEFSFDTFQKDRDKVYRIYSKFQGNFDGTNIGVPTALPVFIRDHFTGIDAVTNFHTLSCDITVPAGDIGVQNLRHNDKIIIAGPDYFDVFEHYEWSIGDPHKSLGEPFRVVLTESQARNYFGDVDLVNVIGRAVHYQDSLVVTVSGIVKDITENTDFDFTDFISFSTVERSWLEGNKLQVNNWNAVNSSSQLFIKLSEGTAPEKIESQLSRIAQMYEAQGSKWDEWRPMPKMQSLSDLHLNPGLGIFDHSRSVLERSTLDILVGVAGLLLVMAVINFVNIETAQASRRAKEVAVRKVLGSPRRKLVSRFLCESFILCSLAGFLSVCWTELAFQYLPEYMPDGLTFNSASQDTLLFLVCCVASVTLLAGLYPAFIIASFKPALALRNQIQPRRGSPLSAYVRKGLTLVQFSFSQVFVTGSLIVGLQLYFMVNKDLGFDPDAVVSVHTPANGNKSQQDAFAIELAAIPAIETFCRQMSAPIAGVSFFQEMSFEKGNETVKYDMYVKMADTSYLSVYGLELLAGRNVFPVASFAEVLINESCMRLLGFTNPEDVVGNAIDKDKTIVGVVRDFHTASMHQAIQPTVIAYGVDDPSFGIRLRTPVNKVSDIGEGLLRIETAWKKVYPDEPFNVSFLVETIGRFYENEKRAGKLAVMATMISLVISSLGLFGLTTFTVIQRTKEIGIRKVLGATVKNILFLFSKDFLQLVLIAFAISAPVAYYTMDQWLTNFAYRVNMSAWIFVASAAVSIFIAFATIAFRTVHAAKADPVKSLRYE